ncbi:hypothetical protein RJG79_05320 [Mycoplasmatota bacterium WC44]
MAGTIAHLVIADKVLNKFKDNIGFDTIAYYIGAIAPDSIKSKRDYTRNDMKYTHLREGIRDKDWLKTKNQVEFQRRVKRFMGTYLINKDKVDFEFNLGYFIHLLTDEYNHKTIRQLVLKCANKRCVTELDKEFYHMMVHELDSMDQYLLRNNPNIPNILKQMFNYEEELNNEYISHDIIERSFDWIRSEHLPSMYNKHPKYLSYEIINDFIREVTEIILETLISEEINCR